MARARNISLTASFTDGAQWPPSAAGKAKLQPIFVTLTASHSIAVAAANDDLNHSINYSTLCNIAIDVSKSRSFSSSEDFVDEVQKRCFFQFPGVQAFTVTLKRPKALLQPAVTEVTWSKARGTKSMLCIFAILGMEGLPIVGINPCERVQKQAVKFDICARRSTPTSEQSESFPFRGLYLNILEEVNQSSYLTLEALVSHVADLVLKEPGLAESVTVRGGKPNALACAEAAEVEIHRSAPSSAVSAPAPSAGLSVPPGSFHGVAVALGSNLGDRFANIERALRLIERPPNKYGANGVEPYISVIDTSFLYETEPMYVTDQPKFVNCTCLEIEATVGRVASFRNGPRAIDLDILTYDDEVIDTRTVDERGGLDNLTGHLLVPHPRIVEREFVLRPLNDIIPDYRHPVLQRTVHELFTSLISSQPTDTPVMNMVTPFPQYPTGPSENMAEKDPLPVVPTTAAWWTFPSSGTSPSTRKTYLMATLNATPDSFSDGSINNTVPAALKYATSSVAAGADVIDIGGYSTRPGAAYVSPEEEIARVVPVIRAIRYLSDSPGTDEDPKLKEQTSRALLSVDTFRWDVAEAAIRAGANCINDVYAFTGPTYPVDEPGWWHLAKMRQVARDLAVPVILMHARGEASANKDYSEYAYAADARGKGAVVEAVKVELGEKVDAIVKGKGGVRRWYVIVDPGVGFSKTVEGNLEVVRQCSALTEHTRMSNGGLNPLSGFPVLIGTSRKSYLGSILEKEDHTGTYAGRKTAANERDPATAAAVACAVQQGAAVIRVHDVLGMGDVVRVASQLWP
ncbi:hypothetical protein EIP86_001563 [Pleurotus ostreatoroseus]|nr:hypothetical protein EIP86_001563 [Pleurotus ostreatoroseus]